jgi:hypothetical protein
LYFSPLYEVERGRGEFVVCGDEVDKISSENKVRLERGSLLLEFREQQ